MLERSSISITLCQKILTHNANRAIFVTQRGGRRDSNPQVCTHNRLQNDPPHQLGCYHQQLKINHLQRSRGPMLIDANGFFIDFSPPLFHIYIFVLV
jgi:hypothetical protein